MAAPSFDYIIIGGGTAGLVVATRLSEDPNVSVCVIEAGGDHIHELDNQVPGFGFKNIGREDIHFLFQSVPQKYANNREIYIPRGKALGGSSSVNYMALGRGHKDEYDALEELGNAGWNWNSLVEYMKKSETYTVTAEDARKFGIEFDPAYHGDSGPIHRTLPKWIPGLHDLALDAFKKLGVPYNQDPTCGDNTGAWASNHAIHHSNSIRSAAAPSYYDPVRERQNLHVITYAHVTRLLTRQAKHGENITIEAVQYKKNGSIHTVTTKGEVILAAGAFCTPQVLELSGLGDPRILEAHGITPIVNLPGVGNNLQDHFWVWTTFEIASNLESIEVLQDPERFAQEWETYQRNRTGILSTAGASVFSFLTTPSFKNDEELLAQIDNEADRLASKSKYTKGLNIQRGWVLGDRVPSMEFAHIPGFMPATNKKPEPGKRYISFLSSIQHAFSRGSVHITSTDPLAAPTIDPSCLDNNIDMDLMVEGIKFTRKIASTYGDTVIREVHPGTEFASDEELKEVIRDTILTAFHPIGTAAMLSLEDGGVVNSQLQVYGTANLRIADASILPLHLSNHPMTIVYGLAEKAADIIKQAATSSRSLRTLRN